MSDTQLWSFGKGAARTLKSRITLNNGEAIRDMAIAGLGLAILPGFIAGPAIAEGHLERVLPGVTTRKMPIVALWPPTAPMPAKLRLFVDHLVAELGGAPPW